VKKHKISKIIKILFVTFFLTIPEIFSIGVIKGKHIDIIEKRNEIIKIGYALMLIAFIFMLLGGSSKSFITEKIVDMTFICLLVFFFAINIYFFSTIWYSIFKKRLQDESEK
jgi:hypothetical protein